MLTNTHILNLVQTPEELKQIYQNDYYWYLRSYEFQLAFLKPIADIINTLGKHCLDCGCGEGVIEKYIEVPYLGFDGSERAIEIANLNKAGLFNRFIVDRVESPTVSGIFPTVLFGGMMEVIVKQESRVNLLEMYQERYKVEHFIIYDLERLDTKLIERRYGLPVIELHRKADIKENILQNVKTERKILVYRCC